MNEGNSTLMVALAVLLKIYELRACLDVLVSISVHVP
jgi:hypothetical protein